MAPRIRRARPLLTAACLLALTGGADANPFLCCRAGSAVAAALSQVPPIRPGMARVWFLRQFEPYESLATPMISANGVPVGLSEPGTAFIRDFLPGTYTFTVPSYGIDSGQAATVQLLPRTQSYLEVQSLSRWASCGDACQRDTLYVRAISPDWAEKYFIAMIYLGQR
jgi:hypothetical protein